MTCTLSTAQPKFQDHQQKGDFYVSTNSHTQPTTPTR